MSDKPSHPVTLARAVIDSPGRYPEFVAKGLADDQHLWFAYDHAAEYVMRIGDGDSAPAETISERLGMGGCLDCLSRTTSYTAGHMGYCGEPGKSDLEAEAPTCGCPVQALAATASRECPQGRFRRCYRRAAPAPQPVRITRDLRSRK